MCLSIFNTAASQWALFNTMMTFIRHCPDLSIRQSDLAAGQDTIDVAHCNPADLTRHGLHRDQLRFEPPWGGEPVPGGGRAPETSGGSKALEPKWLRIFDKH